ncbi:hypothetical protein HDV01_005869 [Terramyces sp. JEL0728]|nr:hypothetical protein HDV01_005869 [Terramyces sp. JEL0728]
MYSKLIILFGVSGCGKTYLGLELSKTIPSVFIDADDFHPIENKQKMTNNIPLEDKDRYPWLQAIIKHLKTLDGTVILACSCLKKKYREMFSDAIFVYLKVDKQTLTHRLETRNHFFKKELLDSQLGDFEEPVGENVLVYKDTPTLLRDLNTINLV